ncbi:MAG TPA: ABC-F family ATP-binding cassette domain-containing protein [Tepidiformaceae bacterium]|nr:ABC-F family ATP-binding cassette domain-containing protein [Tepidiformaceae bacterium]
MHIENLSKELGGRTVLDRVSFVANRGEVTGIVGPNGSGKTTLLRIIAGGLSPDSGAVELAPGARVAYLAQGIEAPPETPAGDVFLSLTGDDAVGQRVASLADAIADEPDPARQAALSDEYDALLDRLASPAATEAGPLRAALGLRRIAPWTPIGQLSGGELTKLALIEAASALPDLLLLDEPTNHLDLAGIEWVEDFLREFPGVALVVSHDRALLDACAQQIVELDATTGHAETFAGDYSAYADEKARREEEAWERYRRQQREERRLKQTISEIESRARNTENRTIDFYYRKRAAKVARRAVTLRARVERELASADHAERPSKPLAAIGGSFQAESRSAGRLIAADSLSLAAGGRVLFTGLTFEIRRGERVVLAGPNGSGKTTVLRAILKEIEPANGLLDVSGSARVGYLPQSEDELASMLGPADSTAVDALRRHQPITAAEAANFLHRFLLGRDQLATPIGRMSFGERRRLALAILIAAGSNMLLLDEPTNHLDVPSREAFESAFESFTGAAFVVTHDRYFIDRFAQRVVDLA